MPNTSMAEANKAESNRDLIYESWACEDKINIEYGMEPLTRQLPFRHSQLLLYSNKTIAQK